MVSGPLLMVGFVALVLVLCVLIDRRDERARKRRAAQDVRERQHMARMVEDVRRWDR